MTVPFVRFLSHKPPAEVGEDVRAIQRALHAAGELKAGYNPGHYGTSTSGAVGRFQRHHGLKPDCDYGPATHLKLSPHFDAYGRLLIARALHDLHQLPRAGVVHTGMWYYGERLRIAYSQFRPIYTVYHGCKPPCVPPYLDCSGLFISCYWDQGLIAKLGNGNQGGYGNTWSLWAMGRPVNVDNAQPGDAIFYNGPISALQHVALVVGPDRVLSNGHHPMGLYPFDMQPGYLRIAGARSYL